MGLCKQGLFFEYGFICSFTKSQDSCKRFLTKGKLDLVGSANEVASCSSTLCLYWFQVPIDLEPIGLSVPIGTDRPIETKVSGIVKLIFLISVLFTALNF